MSATTRSTGETVAGVPAGGRAAGSDPIRSDRLRPSTGIALVDGTIDPSQVIDGEQLFGPSDWVVIAYRGQTYRLSRTRAGKLILTK